MECTQNDKEISLNIVPIPFFNLLIILLLCNSDDRRREFIIPIT